MESIDLQEYFKYVFEPELIEKLNEKGKIIKIEEGNTILDYGQIVNEMPIVLSGSLKVLRIEEDSRELLIYYVNKNESCAMTFSCCMEKFPSEIKTIAEEDSTFLSIPIEVMDEWIVKYPSWKSFVMKTIRNRFNELLRTIDFIAFQNMDARLLNYLKEKSKATSSTLINLSHEQIANELATSRVVISRLLKKLEIDKKVILYRHQIKLLREM
jgi:CRP/FNR family transcriptional regulator